MISLTKIAGLAVQIGLVFELSGTFILAVPGLAISYQRPARIAGIRIEYVWSFLFGAAFSCLSFSAALLILHYDLWRPATCLLSIATFVAWLPCLLWWAIQDCGDVGMPPSDAQRDRLHMRGVAFLAIGFTLQSLAASLT